VSLNILLSHSWSLCVIGNSRAYHSIDCIRISIGVPYIKYVALSCIISETKRSTGQTIFPYPPCIRRPAGGCPSKYWHNVCCGKTRMVWLLDDAKSDYNYV